MRRIPESELRFHLKRALQLLPRSTLRDLTGSDEARSRGLEAGADVLMARFEGMEVMAPDPAKSTFQAQRRR